MAAVAQLTLDGADRLHELLCTRRAPVGLTEAAACLFALRSAPSALVHQLVDEVVRADPRLVWRSAGEVALADWDEVAPLLDVPLERAEYVVFDLETTGTRAGVSRIVELGAVRMSGFSEAARMQRLVDPGCMVPAQITAITGITQHHVRGRPRVGPVLDEFLRFSAGAVLVAHNARFDIGFVDADLARLRSGRLAAPVIDTVALARRLMGDRLERMNLGTLAERFDTEVRPCHRALPDALATAEVLVRLLGLAQERGAATVADVIGLCAPERRRVRTRRGLAKGAPTGPGVYLFRDAGDAVLYVGKATDLRARVRSYFSGRALRAPVERALEATARIETRPLGSEFEAALLELELIAGLRPPANSRAPRAGPGIYLTLTLGEQVPRLRVTSGPGPPGTVTAGPLRSRAQAEAAAAAARSTFGLRVCRPRLPVDDGTCLAGILGSCHAPCRGGERLDRYADAIEDARLWLEQPAGGAPAAHLDDRMRRLSAEHRYEEAAAARDQLAALRTAGRTIERMRRARLRNGVILAPDTDDRFVQAFACASGRVVARRRLPRAGDGRLEAEPLLAALAHGLAEPPGAVLADRRRAGPPGHDGPRPAGPHPPGGRGRRRDHRRGGTSGGPAARGGTLTLVNFGDRLAAQVERTGSTICVGLDPRIELLPPALIAGLHPGPAGRARAYERFCTGVIDAVAEHVAAVKPQVAFFEALGGPGLTALERVCAHARDADLLVIADAKRGDIGSTAEAYAQAWVYRRDGGPPTADAVTVNPYLGGDSLEPFFAACHDGAGVFVVTRTSNPGSTELQEAVLADGRPVWERTAELVAGWGAPFVGEAGLSAVGAVVGATWPEAVARARDLMPHQPLLLPGVGAQGGAAGDLQAAFRDHPAGGLVVAARSVIYAWRERGGDWQQGVRTAAAELRRAAVPA